MHASVLKQPLPYTTSSSSSRKDDQPTQTVVLERFEDVRVADELPRPPRNELMLLLVVEDCADCPSAPWMARPQEAPCLGDEGRSSSRLSSRLSKSSERLAEAASGASFCALACSDAHCEHASLSEAAAAARCSSSSFALGRGRLLALLVLDLAFGGSHTSGSKNR